MKLSRREAVFGLATGVVALFGLSAVVAKPAFERWTELRRDRAAGLLQIEKDKLMVGERGKWSKRFDEINKVLPPFPADKKMDAYWGSIMDSLASKNGVVISKRRVGEEKKIGDLYEMSIDCQDCEGTLDAMMRFLFDLQQQGAMLDVRQLLLKPKSATVLRGRFTLYCAYTRQGAGK
jgi:hypothetical protein